MLKDFQDCVAFVLGQEGGYSNDPNDPGGETNFGISKRSYPDVDIASLDVTMARMIYRRDYWDKIRCGEMPPALAAIAFDCAVNQGTRAAVLGLQNAVTANIVEDGIIGPKTLEAARHADSDTGNRFLLWREARYRSNPNFHLYGNGWLNRLDDLRKALEAA